MNRKQLRNALLIGRVHSLAWTLPQLLSRAGFCVDVITSSPLMKSCKHVRNCDVVPHHQLLIPAISHRMKKGYDWIIVTDDGTLTEISESSLSLEDKLKLLPIRREENFSHLFSKIGLSKALSSGGVNTPAFFVANNITEALLGADQLGYPVFLKVDSSGGGYGVFECNAPSDLAQLKAELFDKPVLIQKKISGIELDLSALYLGEDLVHFSHSKVEKVCLNKFGPSLLRTYRPLNFVEPQIFDELSHIGKVLGAHGFTNISCIQSEGRRFYIEVDMRPNVWVQIPKYFEKDPAIKIQRWFSHGEKLNYPVLPTLDQPSEILVPYFLRLKWFELLFNRYQVWKFVSKDDLRFFLRLVMEPMISFAVLFPFRVKHHTVTTIKRIIPQKYHDRIRRIKHLMLRAYRNCFKNWPWAA